MQSKLLTLAIASACLCTRASAQTVLKIYTGSPADEFGAAVLWTADQNNDGYPDVLVGAPGYNGGRGYIRALSGKYMVTNTGNAVLWTYMPAVNAGARFGSSLAAVATLTGDIATDFAVGAPGFMPSVTPRGAVFLVDGTTHVAATYIAGNANSKFGASIAALGDQDGDGKIDIAVSAPSFDGTASWVSIIPGSSFFVSTDLSSVPHGSINSNGSSLYGAIVASGFDLDGDGKFDLAIGSPDFLGYGVVDVMKADQSFTFLASYGGATTGERMGASIDGTRDFDGDGVVDLVVGAPSTPGSFGTFTTEVGRAVVLSGAKLRTYTTPYEIYKLTTTGSSIFNTHFGAAVRACGDLNGDGTSEILVGAPNFSSGFTSLNRGFVSIFSGATGAKIATLFGNSTDRLGDALAAGLLDINSDGFLDFTVAGSLSDNGTVDCGTVDFCSLFPSSWSTYCTAKINSLGCASAVSAIGTISASSAGPFMITCSNAINQTSGLFFYSHAPIATPFQGGYLCVNTPFKRLSVLNSGGNAGGPDCSGVFNFDFGAYRAFGGDATLVAGSEVFAQCWSRDPASASTTNLSNGLRFLINP